jgi:hypothetical protein
MKSSVGLRYRDLFILLYPSAVLLRYLHRASHPQGLHRYSDSTNCFAWAYRRVIKLTIFMAGCYLQSS